MIARRNVTISLVMLLFLVSAVLTDKTVSAEPPTPTPTPPRATPQAGPQPKPTPDTKPTKTPKPQPAPDVQPNKNPKPQAPPRIEPAKTPKPPPSPKAGERGQSKRHGLKGLVRAKTPGSLTLDTKQGKIEVMVSPSTKYKVPGVKNATLANVLVGGSVAVNGVWANGVYTARQLMVILGKPEHAHRVGSISAYTPGSSLTILDKKWGTTTFALRADTQLKLLPGVGEPKVGDLVTVIAPRDPGSEILVAKALVVHPTRQGTGP